jgi:hypothetical protein
LEIIRRALTNKTAQENSFGRAFRNVDVMEGAIRKWAA